MNLRPEHPYCDHMGYVLQHRLVYEEYLTKLNGITTFINPKVHIHHIIPVKDGGTNDISNLQLITNSQHMKLHKTKDMSSRVCNLCNSSKTQKEKSGTFHWYRYKDGFICMKCYKDLKKNKN